MGARGDAASHTKGIGSNGDRPSEGRDAQVGPSGDLLAFFADIAPTWVERKPLHCCLMADHMLCLANGKATHK